MMLERNHIRYHYNCHYCNHFTIILEIKMLTYSVGKVVMWSNRGMEHWMMRPVFDNAFAIYNVSCHWRERAIFGGDLESGPVSGVVCWCPAVSPTLRTLPLWALFYSWTSCCSFSSCERVDTNWAHLHTPQTRFVSALLENPSRRQSTTSGSNQCTRNGCLDNEKPCHRHLANPLPNYLPAN